MLSSFNALLYMIFHWDNDIVSSSQSIGEPFFFLKKKKAFHGRWKVYEGSSTLGTNVQIMPRGWRRFTNTFSSNLETVNPNIFPNHGGI